VLRLWAVLHRQEQVKGRAVNGWHETFFMSRIATDVEIQKYQSMTD
jgi:hypothetical protein